jgi:hypothetical protein
MTYLFLIATTSSLDVVQADTSINFADNRINDDLENDIVIINQGDNNGYKSLSGLTEPTEPTGSTSSQRYGGPTTTSGNDNSHGYSEESDPSGKTGTRGESESSEFTVPTGKCNWRSKTILVSQDRTATMDDYYIGVTSDGSVTITLPRNIKDCKALVVKEENSSSNRNITFVFHKEYAMSASCESVSPLYRDSSCHII